MKQKDFDQLIKRCAAEPEARRVDRKEAQRQLHRLYDRGIADINGPSIWPPRLNPDHPENIADERGENLDSTSTEECPVHEFVQNYYFAGDGGDHTPTDAEKAMLEDAIHGYLDHVKQHSEEQVPEAV